MALLHHEELFQPSTWAAVSSCLIFGVASVRALWFKVRTWRKR